MSNMFLEQLNQIAGDLHHGWVANKHAAAVWCYHMSLWTRTLLKLCHEEYIYIAMLYNVWQWKSHQSYTLFLLLLILHCVNSQTRHLFTSAKSNDCVTSVTSSLSLGLPLHCAFVCERHGVTVSDTHLKSHPFPPQLSKQRQLGWEEAETRKQTSQGQRDGDFNFADTTAMDTNSAA